MLGYTSNDVNNMIMALEIVSNNSEGADVDKYLLDTIDLLNGLLTEGYIQ